MAVMPSRISTPVSAPPVTRLAAGFIAFVAVTMTVARRSAAPSGRGTFFHSSREDRV